MMEARARERLAETARLITDLEKTGLLDRRLEFLPDEVEIEERRQREQGLTRPELAVILSYAKIDLYNGLEKSDQALDDFLTTDPQRYFPPVLRRRYPDLIPRASSQPANPGDADCKQHCQSYGTCFRQANAGRYRSEYRHHCRAYVVATRSLPGQLKSGERSNHWTTRSRRPCSNR